MYLYTKNTPECQALLLKDSYYQYGNFCAVSFDDVVSIVGSLLILAIVGFMGTYVILGVRKNFL